MSSPSVDIKDMLVADGIVIFKSTCFIGDFPDAPDLCATISEYNAIPVNCLREKTNLLEVFINIRIRGSASLSGYEAGRSLAVSISAGLDMTIDRSQGGYVYTIQQINGPFAVGKDSHNRLMWSTNFRCWRKS